MTFSRTLLAVVLLALMLPPSAGAQQRSLPKPPTKDPIEQLGPLESVIYQKERLEEYLKELERARRLREMETWDNQRRIVRREVLNVHCTWKRSSGKTVTRVFKQRVAPSCEEAIADLSKDLGGSLSAECTCTGASPTADTP
ncbi:hypothetical protein MYX64_08915 [Nitrospinae bacterium AH_259_B05_G02_I21]|nr:hypothetical protein [Nitrospinae bacterium AH_259_B05_G02_I21]